MRWLGLLATAALVWTYQDRHQNREEETLKRVTGIGGVFFKSDDPAKLRGWYARHLDIVPQNESVFTGGTVAFRWGAGDTVSGHTVWGPFPKDTTYFEPSSKPFMFNYRVHDLDALIAALEAEGIEVEPVEEYPYGRFAWLMDPEGNRIELWEPAPGR